MDTPHVYHTHSAFEWSMYNTYHDEAATSYMPSWSAVDATSAAPMNDNSSYAQQHPQQQHHFGYANSPPPPSEAPLPTFVQHAPQPQPSNVRYFAPSVAPSPLAPFHSSYPEYSYVAQAPPTPGLDFLPSPINGNTPEWAFPNLDESVRGGGYVEGPALPRSAPIVAPLPISPAFGAYRPTPDVVSSPSDIGTEDIFGGRHQQLHRPRHHHVPLKQMSSSASGPVQHILPPQAFTSPPPSYTSPSPSLRPSLEYAASSPSPPPQLPPRRRKWTSDDEEDAEDSDYKPSVRIAASFANKRLRHSPTATSPTSTSPRGRLSTTSHGCRPQTTLDPSCLLNTKMVRAPAKDDIDDQYKPFTCHYGHDGPNGACGKGFHKKNEWKRHLRTIHAWDEALQIQRGELSFQQAKLVQDPEAHKEMIAEITRCFCAGCGKLFARPEILTRHWNNVEKAEKRKALKAAKEQAAIRAKARGATSKRASR